MRHKSDLEVRWLKGRNAPRQDSRFCTTHDPRSEVHEIGVIVNDEGGCRAGMIRIGYGRASSEQYDSVYVFLVNGKIGVSIP